jgi:hypothetical protein
MRYLKSISGCCSAAFCPWNVSFNCPAIISHHTGTPLALVPLFHGGNIMVKSLSFLIAQFSENFQEEV